MIFLLIILFGKKNKPVIIDFDECVVAPIGYEFIVFLIKYCFQNGIFDLQKANRIMRQYHKIFSTYYKNSSYLKELWYFYISKVLLEKLYYYDLGYIELEDPIQIKDNYLWWLKLLTDQYIVQQLFDK